jgi:hypothetical protein
VPAPWRKAAADAPFELTGKLIKVVVTMDDDQVLDGDGVGGARLSAE